MTDVTTQRVVPVACFQCGQLLNCHQEAFDALVRAGVSLKEAMAVLGVTRLCCKVNLSTPPDDPRLRRVWTRSDGFTKVHHEPPSDKPYALFTDGRWADGVVSPAPASA